MDEPENEKEQTRTTARQLEDLPASAREVLPVKRGRDSTRTTAEPRQDPT